MKWYQLKEQAAGEKRLILLWHIYKIFGKKAVKIIVFFVTLFAYLGAKEPKRCSKKYLSVVGLEPTFANSLKHFLAYSYSLIDRMEVFAGLYDPEKITFDSEQDKTQLENDLDKGVFFVCSHVGNIEIMRAFLLNSPQKHVNIFLSKEQCKIFNNFVKHLQIKTPITTYPVEDINIETSIEIKDKISNGDIVIMAGDRISKNSKNSFVEFLGHKVQLPLGTFKFAHMMECPIYFVCALNNKGDRYKIYLNKFNCNGTKQEAVHSMQAEYAKFLEKLTLTYPFQFFHFYDFFE